MAQTAEHRVILGLRGSAGDPSAIHTAMGIARALDAVLYAVDVQTPRNESTVDQRATPRIQDAYFAFSKAGGLPDDADVRIIVIDGEPGEELVRLANKPTDLLVIERDGDEQQGSVTRSCIANATCPVIVVPPQRQTPGRQDGSARENSVLGIDRTRGNDAAPALSRA